MEKDGEHCEKRKGAHLAFQFPHFLLERQRRRYLWRQQRKFHSVQSLGSRHARSCQQVPRVRMPSSGLDARVIQYRSPLRIRWVQRDVPRVYRSLICGQGRACTHSEQNVDACAETLQLISSNTDISFQSCDLYAITNTVSAQLSKRGNVESM